MSNIQIPNLPAAIALNGTEQLEGVQAGTSVKLTVAQLGAYITAQYPAPGVTSIATSAPITGGTITTSGTIGLAGAGVTNYYLASMSAGTVKANLAGSPAQPTDATPSAVLDLIGSTRGSVLYRGVSGWQALPPGTAGYVLATDGLGADPTWINPSSAGSSLTIGTTPVYSGTSGRILYDNGGLLGEYTPQAAAVQISADYVVNDLAALKALAAPYPASVMNKYRSVAGDMGGGVWVFRTGDQSANVSADTQSGVWAAPNSDPTGASGAWQRECTPYTVRLEWFDQTTNPLQGAFNCLGVVGGKIIVPNKMVTISTPAVSPTNLQQIQISGEGNDSALYFTNAAGANGVGGISLTMYIPDGTAMNREQVLIENLAILCGHYAADGTTNGSGIGLYIGWQVAVGSVNLGLTMRNVQFGPRNKYASAGQYAWWDTCLQVYNGRQITLQNIYCFGAEKATRSGVGIDLNGGTVQIQLEDINVADMDKGVYINGVCEGVQWNRGVTIGNNYGVYFDGNALGRALTTSTTSQTIGTGSKTFTVAHNIGGPNSLAFTSAGQTLTIRDAANQSTNWMSGTITSYTTNTVTVNITSKGGSGTISNWLVSAAHPISQIAMGDFHANNYLENFHFEWTAFSQLTRCQHQRYENVGSFTYINCVTNTLGLVVADMVIGGGVSGGTGINIASTYGGLYNPTTDARNFYISIHDIFFVSAVDAGIVIGEYTQHVDIHGVRAAGPGVPVPMIVNNVTGTQRDIRVYDCWDDDNQTNATTAFAANSATPSVAPDGVNYWATNNSVATNITGFLNGGCVSNTFRVLINDANTTLVHSATLLLKDALNFSPPSGTVMEFVQESATVIREIDRTSSALTGQTIFSNGAVTFGGGISNGFYWNGWLYNTTNVNTSLPTHTQGLATAWNYSGGAEINYVNGWNNGAHKFQYLNSGALYDANITARAGTFTTPDSTVNLRLAGATGRLILTGYNTGSASSVIDSINTAEDTFIPLVLTSSQLLNKGPLNVQSSSANALAVGRLDVINPAFNVDASTASSATGLNIKAAAAGGGVALSALSSGTNENLTIDAKGSGTITLGGTSTGSVAVNRALTYGGVTLANSVTGTGSMVLSASPTLTTPNIGAATGLSIDLTPNTVGSPSTARAIKTLQYASGTVSGPTSLNWQKIFSDDINATNGGGTDYFVEGWTHEHYFGGNSVRGGRNALTSYLYLTSTTNAASDNRNYVAVTGKVVAQTNDNGTNTTFSGSAGAFFGGGLVAVAQTGATNLHHVTGAELDVAINTGASAYAKAAITLCGVDGDDVQASTINTFIWAYKQTGVKFTTGILFDYPQDPATCFPFDSTSTVLKTGTGTIGIGVDFSGTTVSSYAFKSPGFDVNGAGLVTASSAVLTASGDTGLEIKTTGGVTSDWLWQTLTADGRLRLYDLTGGGEVLSFAKTTGAITLGKATTFLAAITYGGVTLSNSVTGTGSMVLSASPTLTGTLTAATVTASGIVTGLSATAVGAGANTQAFIKASSTANLGIYYGTGDPTFTAAKGSLYSKTDATTTTTRLWVNTDGGTTWAYFTASA